MKVAYFSPLNPRPSGICDYSEALLPHLARLCELDVFIEDYVPSNDELRRLVHIAHRREFQESRYDGIIYEIGNNPDHVYVYDMAMRVPGTVVFHEVNLHHLLAAVTIVRKDWEGYFREMEYNG